MWWTIAAAREWFREREESARILGWQLSLTGSVLLFGEGRDLDVIAIPINSDAADLCKLWDDSEWENIRDPSEFPTGVKARVYEDEYGRLIDMMFLPRRTVPEGVER